MSILDSIKRAFGPVVIPLFAVDDTPPAFEDGDSRPAQLNKTTGGIKTHLVGSSATIPVDASVQGYTVEGEAWGEKPVRMGLSDAGTARTMAGDSAGRAYTRAHDGTHAVGRLNGLDTRPDKVSSDAYGMTLVTSPTTILEFSFINGLSPNEIGTLVVGGGSVSWSSPNRMAALTVGSANGDSARIATHRSTLADRNHSGGPTIHFQTGASHPNTRYIAMITDTSRSYGFGIVEQGGTISIAVFHPLGGGIVFIPSSSWNIATGAEIGLTSLSNTVHTIYGRGSGDGGFGTIIFVDGIAVHFLGNSPSPLFFPTFAWRVGAQVENVGAAVGGTMFVKSGAFTVYSAQPPKLHAFTVNLGAPKIVGTTLVPLYAVRPRDIISGYDNPLSIFPSEIRAQIDTGTVTVQVWHQKGGTDPLGGTGTWLPITDMTYEVNLTPTTFTPNANTALVGECGSNNNVDDLSNVFGVSGLGAIKKRFGVAAPASQEQVIVTAFVANSSHPVNALLTGGQQITG